MVLGAKNKDLGSRKKHPTKKSDQPLRAKTESISHYVAGRNCRRQARTDPIEVFINGRNH